MKQWTFTPCVKSTQEYLEAVTVEAEDFVKGWEKSDKVLKSRGIETQNGDGSRRIGYITIGQKL